MKQEIDNNLLADCFKAAMNVYGEERQNKKRTTRTTR